MGSRAGSWAERRASQWSWEAAAVAAAAAWFIKMGVVCQGCLHRLEDGAISQDSSLKIYVSIIAISLLWQSLACVYVCVCVCV